MRRWIALISVFSSLAFALALAQASEDHQAGGMETATAQTPGHSLDTAQHKHPAH